MMHLALVTVLLSAGVAFAASLKIPSAAGSVVVDGKLDEPMWQRAVSASLNSPTSAAGFPAGGEARLVVCGAHLCLGARLPESGRLVAISQGRDPSWRREDQVIWTLAVHVNKRNIRRTLTVNPFGAYSFDSTAVVTTDAGRNEWIMEAAIPLSELANIGFVSVQRVRVPRTNAPELRWYWPGLNERMDFELPGGSPKTGGEPIFRPIQMPSPQRESRAVSTGLAAELARQSVRIWSNEERENSHAALQNHLRRRMTEAALAERREWKKVTSRAEWEQFRDRRIGSLRESFGPFPERTPLRTAVTRRADYGNGLHSRKRCLREPARKAHSSKSVRPC